MLHSQNHGGAAPVLDNSRAALSQIVDALGKLKRGDETAGFWFGDVWFEFGQADIATLTREVAAAKAAKSGARRA